VKLADALEAVADFSAGDRLEGLKQHLNPDFVEDALTWAGTTSVRRRRLPAEQVVWLVIGMALRRNESIERVADVLGLAAPDRRDTLLAKSGIAQARKRLTAEPLAYLFHVTAAEWSARSAEAHRWRGFAVYGMDGTTIRVADSPENRAAFGGQSAGGGRGESGYPQVRVVAMMALRSHILSGFRMADYHTGETTLARDIWNEVPENSLVIFDRAFLVKKDLVDLETSGNRQWISRTKSNTTWAIREKLGRDDNLVDWELKGPGLPTTWTLRAIHYQKKGYPRTTLLTSLLDPKLYPAKEIIALYHERWETEIGHDEMKTHMLERQETIRSRTPDGVRQELWGIAIAYNLVRLEMERTAVEAKVSPTRISFVHSLLLVRDELGGLMGPRLPLGTIPKRLQHLRRNMKRLVLPERRSERIYPRAVKVKMSNYPRKRPSVKRPK
jgi:hypothetical protein